MSEQGFGSKLYYQTAHLLLGFILLPGAHLNASAKYLEFDNVPMTLKNNSKKEIVV